MIAVSASDGIACDIIRACNASCWIPTWCWLPCAIGATRQSVLSALDFIAAIADEAQGHFRWRPQVRDPADEMVLEAAVNGRASVLMTFNRRDFGAAPARFGIRLCAPGDFLRSLRT